MGENEPNPPKRSRLSFSNPKSGSTTPQDKNMDYLCPICFELITEAHMTRCGHTFCYPCLLQTIEQSARCPKCNFALDSTDQIFPNFLLNELVSKYKNSLENKLRSSSLLQHPDLASFRNALSVNSDSMSLPDVELMLKLLETKKQQLAANSLLAQKQLLREFLQHLKKQKDEQLFTLQKEAAVIQGDLDHVEQVLRELEKPQNLLASSDNLSLDGENSSDCGVVPSVPSIEREQMQIDTGGFNLVQDKTVLGGEESSLPARRQRMHHHFSDLVSCYTGARIQQLTFSNAGVEEEGVTTEPDRWSGLDMFGSCLSSLTRYNSVRPLATLAYTTDMFNNSSIVSSIEFDKNQEFFAIAGVTKRIKIYDYNVVLKDMVDIHYPSTEMVCSSKISCISWSSFHKGMLASSDYEGTVIVWDSATNTKSTVWQEHEKRCWSVDFNLVDTKLIASGSDDARVKLWSTNMSHSVASLEAKANVCCVKFNPSSCYHLAFGSADHCVHYYDLRSTKQPLNVFKGHRKAVSYVKFLNSEDIVSASTDSQLKLWNINQTNCARSFTGHVNEKNFVGLATDGDYITCGSENNGLYIYYKGLSKHLFQFKFDAVRSFLDRDRKEEDVNEFVSAVCWKANSNVMVAANSQGTIKVLELV
eukprot:TRINITY_DN12219_c0_g1_i1.p1 TRINITY_DN12219_c0_g1~~TRINITY_DN12219_c0_g1_i1.p1  ORF type:complete len:658 (+),score=217.02 TRINITY_DN12219_c0_g1_i1:40-1974(+)